jgi:hypothetical protein
VLTGLSANAYTLYTADTCWPGCLTKLKRLGCWTPPLSPIGCNSAKQQELGQGTAGSRTVLDTTLHMSFVYIMSAVGLATYILQTTAVQLMQRSVDWQPCGQRCATMRAQSAAAST